MNRIITGIVVLLILSVSCSKDDEMTSDCPLDPPEWIIGTWEEGFGNTIEWEFSDDEITMTSSSIISQSYCDSYENPTSEQVSIDLEELNNSSTKYAFVKRNDGPGGVEITEYHSFEKVSATKVIYCNVAPPCGNATLTLIKQ